MAKGFWEELSRPIVGLSPMDGITDAAFRFVTAKYGRPAVIFTEFTAVEGLCRGVTKLLEDFQYSEIERPVVAQVFGANPDSFYKAAFIVAALGFDGLDINMGCPDKSVVGKQGAGAALILKPNLARQIIRAAQSGLRDFATGRPITDVGLPSSIVEAIESKARRRPADQRPLPVSVKTRLGFEEVVIEEWVEELLTESPAAISIHGRTLKQMYRGEANWEAIGAAAKRIKSRGALVLGNGDVKTFNDGLEKVRQFGLDGFLIGRASLGNPWVFRENYPTSVEEKLAVMLEQVDYHDKHLSGKPFVNLRKIFGWYCSGFAEAATLRTRLVQTTNFIEVRKIVQEFLGMSELKAVR